LPRCSRTDESVRAQPVLRPLIECSEADIAQLAAELAFPI
jgi:hypothetical protein